MLSPLVNIATKGEAIAIGRSQMNSKEMMTESFSSVAYVKRVIMERGTYTKAWGYGPISTQRRKMIKEGRLDNKGKPIGSTPKNWLRRFLENVLK